MRGEDEEGRLAQPIVGIGGTLVAIVAVRRGARTADALQWLGFTLILVSCAAIAATAPRATPKGLP